MTLWRKAGNLEAGCARLFLCFSHAALQHFGADQAFFRDRRVFWKSIQKTEVSGAFCG